MSGWTEYYEGIKGRLGARQKTFDQIFKFLDSNHHPVIVETGTYREQDNYTGDGCSTLLFDNYIQHNGGHLISIDIDPAACKLARSNTSSKTEIIQSDSVEYLSSLSGNAALLYLDSFNITNWADDWEAASHHLKELFAAKDIICPGTLIVVDDNLILKGKRNGKGRLIYEVMDAIGIDPLFDDYQIGWIWTDFDDE